MICPKCAGKVQAGSSYCPDCGSLISTRDAANKELLEQMPEKILFAGVIILTLSTLLNQFLPVYSSETMLVDQNYSDILQIIFSSAPMFLEVASLAPVISALYSGLPRSGNLLAGNGIASFVLLLVFCLQSAQKYASSGSWLKELSGYGKFYLGALIVLTGLSIVFEIFMQLQRKKNHG